MSIPVLTGSAHPTIARRRRQHVGPPIPPTNETENLFSYASPFPRLYFPTQSPGSPRGLARVGAGCPGVWAIWGLAAPRPGQASTQARRNRQVPRNVRHGGPAGNPERPRRRPSMAQYLERHDVVELRFVPFRYDSVEPQDQMSRCCGSATQNPPCRVRCFLGPQVIISSQVYSYACFYTCLKLDIVDMA